jgi:hypothetical protein
MYNYDFSAGRYSFKPVSNRSRSALSTGNYMHDRLTRDMPAMGLAEPGVKVRWDIRIE